MSKISPKLIDVERNRVEFVDDDDWNKLVKKNYNIYLRKNKSFENSLGVIGDDYINGNGIYGGGKGLGNNKMSYNDSRFPTQLFTNNKKELFKYVKNIT